MAKRRAAKKAGAASSDAANSKAKPQTVYQLVLFQQGRDGISRGLLQQIQSLCDEKVKTAKRSSTIDIWIDSPGGDAHAAIKIYRELRSRFQHIRIAVPDFAKSAATLLCIGGDELFAAAAADFGPLDVQVEHDDREGRVVSALAGANSIEHLAKLGVDLAVVEGPKLFPLTKMTSAEILREMLAYSTKLLEPVLSKLDPQLIHEAAEQLKVARDYAQVILLEKNNPPADHIAAEIATTLVTKYPTHGYVISREELIKLGLDVQPLEEHPEASTISEVYREWSTKHRTSCVQLFAADESPFS